MIRAISIHFQAILRKSSLTAGLVLRALSNSFFKSKVPLGYPKILMIVGLIIKFSSLLNNTEVPVTRHESQNKKRK